MRAFISMGITAVGAINAAIRPNSGMFAAITHIRDNETSIRLASYTIETGGEFLRYAWLLKGQATVLWGYDAVPTAAQNIPLCRGAWQIRQISKYNRTAFLFNVNLRCV